MEYYDPTTGRFLTRGVNPNSTNPYTPWNPIGAIVGPLGLLSLFYSRRKKGGKGGMFLVLLLVLGSVGMTLVACGLPAGSTVEAAVTPVSSNQAEVTLSVNGTSQPPIVVTTPVPPSTIVTALCEVAPTSTPTLTPTETPIPTTRDILLNLYGIKLIDGNLTWSSINEENVLIAVGAIASRMGSADTFRSRFNANSSSPIFLVMGTSDVGDINISDYCENVGTAGCTTGKSIINFKSLSKWNDGCTAQHNVVHELGHIFNNVYDGIPASTMANLTVNPENFVTNRKEILKPNIDCSWQLNDTKSETETFGDFFVAWTYDQWQPLTDEHGNLTRAGKARKWMNEFMGTP